MKRRWFRVPVANSRRFRALIESTERPETAYGLPAPLPPTNQEAITGPDTAMLADLRTRLV